MGENKVETIIKHIETEPDNVYIHKINLDSYIEARTKEMDLNKQLLTVQAEKEITEQDIKLTNKVSEIEQARRYMINLINRERAILTNLEETRLVIDLFETKTNVDTTNCIDIITDNSNHWSRIK